ncbi:putative transmembrane protein [Plasmopara halstedii]
MRTTIPGRLRTLLLTLSLVFSVATIQVASSYDSSSQISLESRVTLGPEGFVLSNGAGRRRSDGKTITHSHSAAIGNVLNAIKDEKLIEFTPARVDFGRVETCALFTQDVLIKNRGHVSITLDTVDFSCEDFSLANDIRSVRLEPGDHFNLQIVYVPSEESANGMDTHLRLSTTSGVFSVPITTSEIVQNRYGVKSLQALASRDLHFRTSLEFTNPLDTTIRLTDMFTLDKYIDLELRRGNEWIRSQWLREGEDKKVPETSEKDDLELDNNRRLNKRQPHRGSYDLLPGITSPLVEVSLPRTTPVGVYTTYIFFYAGSECLLVIPVRITVLTPGVHVIPDKIDLGILLDTTAKNSHEVSLNLYNAGANYIDVMELLVLESNLVVSAQLWDESSVIPPQYEAKDALTVRIRVDTKSSGTCVGSVMLRTNASSDEFGQQILLVYGHVIHGSLVFQLHTTHFGIVMPLANVFRDDHVAEVIEDGDELLARSSEMAATELVSRLDQAGSTTVLAGTTVVRKIRFWNLFDSPVEMQHVWMEPTTSGHDEISVYKFTQGEALTGSYWPEVLLEFTPALQSGKDIIVARSYFLMLETNVSRHRIQLSVYHGFLRANSTRGLHQYSVSGYSSDSGSLPCLEVPKKGQDIRVLPQIDGGDEVADAQAVQICRSLVFDLGKVASHHPRTEVVMLRNDNPVLITLNVSSVSTGGIVGVSIRADISLIDREFAVSGSPPYWYDEVDSNATSSNITISTGKRIELPPGFQVKFYVQVLASQLFQRLTAPVMTVETPTEAFHFYARLCSVQGTVKPVTQVINLPSMLPVHSREIHIQYNNTLEHIVTPLEARVSSSNLKILSKKNTIAPNHVENVLTVRFSPTENSRCLDALFLADCFISLPDSVYEQTFTQLSDYGDFVSYHDLKALKYRNARWGRIRDSKVHMMVESQVFLQTDIVEDIAEVTIKALLERPLVTALASASLQKNSNMSSAINFEVTELHERRQMFVNVRNPSHQTVRMELTIAETDRHMFFSCKSDTDVSADGEVDDETGKISPLCSAEWNTEIDNAVATEWIMHSASNVPPFYFRKRIVQVPAGSEARLGPIYYLPSKVQNVNTTVYVRNRLSHIEAVSIQAHSDKGLLAVSADVVAGPGKIVFLPVKRSDVFEADDLAMFDSHFGDQALLSFHISGVDALTDYTQSANILLTNIGALGLTIRSVNIDEYVDIFKVLSSRSKSSESSAVASRTKDFVVSLEEHTLKFDEDRRIILPANKTASFRLSFRPSCYESSVKGWFTIVSSDSIRLVRLHGSITKGAAISCLRSRTPLRWQIGLYWVWMLATAVTMMTIFHTVSIAYDGLSFELLRRFQLFRPEASTSNETVVPDQNIDTAILNVKQKRPKSCTFDTISRRLEQIKQTGFTPSAHVETRAVSKLMEQRVKELNLSERCSSPSKAVLDDKGKKEAALSITKVLYNEDKDVSSSLVVENDPVGAGAAEPGARDTQGNTVKEVKHKDYTTSTLPEILNVNDRRNSDAEAIDSIDKGSSESSDVGSSKTSFESYQRSPSSSPSRTDHPDDSRLDAVLSEWSLSSLGNQPKLVTTLPPPPIDTSLSTKPEEPFEAFESLSKRWRSKDWQQNLSNSSLSGNFPEWSNSMLFNTSKSDSLGLTASGNRSIETDTSEFKVGPRLNGHDFAASAPRAGSLSTNSTPNAALRKAPPGFTAADAKPLETQAAFGFRRNNGEPSRSPLTLDSTFASKLPLFGPPLLSTSNENVTLGNVGRIGSGRSKVPRGVDQSTFE